MAARTRGAVKAVTAAASGLQLSSGAHDADIQGMRAAILLAALALPVTASASNSSRIRVSAVVLPTLRVSEQVGAPVRQIAAAGGTLYVLPLNGQASQGGAAPSISVEGATLRGSSARDLRIFVPDDSEGRVVVTVLTDGAQPEVRRRR